MDAIQATQLARSFRVQRGRIVVAGDLDSEFAGGRAIQDPMNGTVDAFEASFDRIDRCVAMLAKILRKTAGD
jgi:hypothetical protein